MMQIEYAESLWFRLRPFGWAAVRSIPALAQAFQRMMVSDLRYLPLVDDEGRPVSIVTSRDLIDFLSARVES